MRLFIALELPQQTKQNLTRSAEQFRQLANGGNFIPQQNYHVTLHFLGEVAPTDVIYIQSAMDLCKNLVAPQVAISKFALLRGDIVCAKLKQNAQLDELHNTLGNALEQRNFDVEHSAYRPHVTLIRKQSFTLPFSEVTKSVDVFNKPFVATNITLYQSFLTPQGAEYKPLYTVTLKENE